MATTTCLDISLPTTLASPRLARDRVGELISQATESQRLRDDVRLCVSEAVTNVVRHAYGGEQGAIVLVMERVDEALRVTVRDSGAGIVAPPVDEGRGFGIEIIRRLATSVSVVSAPGRGTEIVMSFELP